jgi:hypothetical protein
VAAKKKSKKSVKKAPPRDALVEHKDKVKAARLAKENKDLLQRLEVAEERAGVVEALRRSSNEPIKLSSLKAKKAGQRIATPCFLWSDWHVEETVDPATVNRVNAYTLEIAEQRVERLGDACVWMIEHHRKSFELREAVVMLDGDLMTGHIHPELVETSSLSPVQAVVWLKLRIRRQLDKILSTTKIEKLTVVCNAGNHGRTTEKTRIGTYMANSYEWLLYQELADFYSTNPRVEFKIAGGEFSYLQIYGFQLRVTHGDAAKYGGGVGGIMIPLNKAISKWDTYERADVTALGHFHQLHFLPRCIVNGSLIGTSAYGMRVGAYEAPAQASWLMDSERGMCMPTTLWPTPVNLKAELGRAA